VVFAVAGRPSGVSPHRSIRVQLERTGDAAFLDFASPSERLRNTRTFPDALAPAGIVRLSWDSFARAPPPTSPSRVHSSLPSGPAHLSVRGIPSRRQPSAARYHTRRMFRPRGFSPPRRFAPRPTSRSSPAQLTNQLETAPGILQPEPAGVRCVAGATDPHRLASQDLGAREKRLSRSAGTLRRTLSIDSRHHLSMAPLPSCGCRPARADPKAFPRCLAHSRALIRRRLWTVPLPVAGLRRSPRPPMGFCTCSASTTEANSACRM
jgi:hypothetical protein